MLTRSILICFSIIAFCNQLRAQEIQHHTFFNVLQETVNPAYSGIHNGTQIASSYVMHWADSSNAVHVPTGLMASASHRLNLNEDKTKSVGIGLSFRQMDFGTENLKTLPLSIAYLQTINDNSKFGIGISYNFKFVDSDEPFCPEEVGVYQFRSNNIGLFYQVNEFGQFKNTEIGFGLTEVNQPEYRCKFETISFWYRVKPFMHTAFSTNIELAKIKFTPQLMLSHQWGGDEGLVLDGVNFNIISTYSEAFKLGLGYRTTPPYVSRASIILGYVIEKPRTNLDINYSYDIAFGSERKSSAGIHQIALAYNIDWNKES